MVDGFAAGGFGTGLLSGFTAGSQANARNRQLGLQERQLEQTEQAAIREQLQKNLGVVNETIDGFRSVVSEAAKNVGPERAMQFLDDPQFQAQIVQAVEVRNAFMTQLGVGGVIKPEDVLAGLRREAQSQPSAQERGRQQGQETLASATAIASGVSGTPDELAENIRTLSGISEDDPVFQTPLGKLIGDRQKAAELFGENSTQVAALDELAESSGTGEPPKLTDISSMRKEFTSESREFLDAQSSLNRLLNTPDTAPGDVALIFNFFGIVEPGGRVTEGEFATAGAAAGLSEQLVRLMAQVDEGRRLSPEQRLQFIEVGRENFRSALQLQEDREEIFRGIAERQGFPVQDTVPSFIRQGLLEQQPIVADRPSVPTISSQEAFDSLPEGAEFIWGPTGERRIK